jgi:hypothetical protein
MHNEVAGSLVVACGWLFFAQFKATKEDNWTNLNWTLHMQNDKD